MPSTLKMTYLTWKIDFEAMNHLAVQAPEITTFLNELESFAANLPLVSFEVKKKPAPAIDEYDYKFTTLDGRTWTQVLTISPQAAIEPLMTFVVSGAFKVSEFMPHRILREMVIAMVQKGQLTAIKATWL